jgi:hypothetical protein
VWQVAHAAERDALPRQAAAAEAAAEAEAEAEAEAAGEAGAGTPVKKAIDFDQELKELDLDEVPPLTLYYSSHPLHTRSTNIFSTSAPLPLCRSAALPLCLIVPPAPLAFPTHPPHCPLLAPPHPLRPPQVPRPGPPLGRGPLGFMDSWTWSWLHGRWFYVPRDGPTPDPSRPVRGVGARHGPLGSPALVRAASPRPRAPCCALTRPT